MTDATAIIYAVTGLAGIALASLVGLAAFTRWIDLKRAEFDHRHGPAAALPGTSNRIEIADLKERIRKLEAIAAGVDL